MKLFASTVHYFSKGLCSRLRTVSLLYENPREKTNTIFEGRVARASGGASSGAWAECGRRACSIVCVLPADFRTKERLLVVYLCKGLGRGEYAKVNTFHCFTIATASLSFPSLTIKAASSFSRLLAGVLNIYPKKSKEHQAS